MKNEKETIKKRTTKVKNIWYNIIWNYVWVLFAFNFHRPPPVYRIDWLTIKMNYIEWQSHTIRFNGHFSRWTWISLVFIEANDDGGGGDNWTTGALSNAKLRSSQIITTNKPTSVFTGRMPFLSPNQQCQSTEGKISHSMDLFSPSSPFNFVSDH